MLALAVFHDCARRLGVDPIAMFDHAAASCGPQTADLVRVFGRRSDITPAAFGFVVVDERDGPVYRWSEPKPSNR
jgi:hypothetical protein